jgi:hypothetical protein
VPVREIGNKLGRNANDIGQKIRHLGLRRSNIAWKKFSNAPEHLKALAGKIPADEWRAKFHSWQSEQSRQAREQKLQAQAQAAAKGAEIDAREDLTRSEKMTGQMGCWYEPANYRRAIWYHQAGRASDNQLRQQKRPQPIAACVKNAKKDVRQEPDSYGRPSLHRLRTTPLVTPALFLHRTTSARVSRSRCDADTATRRRAAEQRERESDAERLGLEINDQLDLCDSHPCALT